MATQSPPHPHPHPLSPSTTYHPPPPPACAGEELAYLGIPGLRVAGGLGWPSLPSARWVGVVGGWGWGVGWGGVGVGVVGGWGWCWGWGGGGGGNRAFGLAEQLGKEGGQAGRQASGVPLPLCTTRTSAGRVCQICPSSSCLLQVLLMFGPEYARACGIAALEPLGIYLPGDKNYPGACRLLGIVVGYTGSWDTRAATLCWYAPVVHRGRHVRPVPRILHTPCLTSPQAAGCSTRLACRLTQSATSACGVREIKNGRLAMVAWLGFAAQAAATRQGPVQNLVDALARCGADGLAAGLAAPSTPRLSCLLPWPASLPRSPPPCCINLLSCCIVIQKAFDLIYFTLAEPERAPGQVLSRATPRAAPSAAPRAPRSSAAAASAPPAAPSAPRRAWSLYT